MNLLPIVLPALLLGAFVTTHVALSAAVAQATPRWRGVLAFVVPPLAPYWGWQANRRRLAALWIALFASYAIALVMTLRS